jgi:hypothetical protein
MASAIDRFFAPARNGRQRASPPNAVAVSEKTPAPDAGVARAAAARHAPALPGDHAP